MDINELIKHPERMDRETLYDLRSLIALCPYYQTARLLMLQNLYLLHDPTFDEELRRAAIYITDRKVLFNLVEAAHYRLRNNASLHGSGNGSATQQADSAAARQHNGNADGGSRTTELIDTFLGTLVDSEEEKKPKGRKPTPADASVDYVAYLIESGLDMSLGQEEEAPQMKGQTLIDNFIFQEGGRIKLPELENERPTQKESSEPVPDEYCTETMAQIYVRQGRYTQALEIIKRLNNDGTKRNAYFADQIRFLEKLILNEKNKK